MDNRVPGKKGQDLFEQLKLCYIFQIFLHFCLKYLILSVPAHIKLIRLGKTMNCFHLPVESVFWFFYQPLGIYLMCIS